MKKFLKHALSAILAVVMVLTAISFAGINLSVKANAMDISSYNVGDIIEFGSYPQSRVTDADTISELDTVAKNWISYEYYSGTGDWSDGNMEPSDYMKYCDFTYGEAKYRAVYFTEYRPNFTGNICSEEDSFQLQSGYLVNTVYYFRFEPLEWIVVNPENGYVMCNKTIDGQAYQNYVFSDGNECYNSKDCKNYSSDWNTSSIRAWLNNDFYYTAFNDMEKGQIDTSYIDNKCKCSCEYDSLPSYDKVFLLSFDEAVNFGFDTDFEKKDKKQFETTDYARCNGGAGSAWWLRTPSDIYSSRAEVIYEGTADFDQSVGVVDGIVPAFRFNSDYIPLSAPTVTLSNVASTGYIKATWDAVDGAKEYKVYRATSKNGTYKLMKTTTSTSYTNTSATAGKTYYYKVQAVGTDGSLSEFSPVKYRTCDLPRPVVTASNVASSGKVKLTWDKVDGATSYKVYRATSKDGTYKLMKTTTSTSYTNTSAAAGTKYYYKVKAVAEKSAADSANSSVVTRTCDLAKPTNVKLSFNSSGKPVVKWSGVEGATSYKVYRATSQNGTYSLMKTTTATTYTNTSISHGTTYYYKVKAACSNTDANSAYSTIVSGYVN